MAEYIDREVAVNAIKKDVMGGLNYESILKRIPSADVQPVKHGRWSRYCCSNCGISKYNFISFNIVGEKEYARPFGTWNYCPRCGAKMDGEDNG